MWTGITLIFRLKISDSVINVPVRVLDHIVICIRTVERSKFLIGVSKNRYQYWRRYVLRRLGYISDVTVHVPATQPLVHKPTAKSHTFFWGTENHILHYRTRIMWWNHYHRQIRSWLSSSISSLSTNNSAEIWHADTPNPLWHPQIDRSKDRHHAVLVARSSNEYCCAQRRKRAKHRTSKRRFPKKKNTAHRRGDHPSHRRQVFQQIQREWRDGSNSDMQCLPHLILRSFIWWRWWRRSGE